MVVGDPALGQKGLIEVDQMGIAANGLGEDVGFEDSGRIFIGDKLLSSRHKRQ